MTWSIVARDPGSGAFGVAIATRFFAVGALCPHADGGVGALASQALMNPTYGPRGLRLLREGVPAADVVRLLTESDPGRETRQLHAQVLDRQQRRHELAVMSTPGRPKGESRSAQREGSPVNPPS